jgi:chromosome partitioning protein
VIIDCPPNLGPLTQNAIFCSTNILVPIYYDNFALRGVKTLFGKVNEVKEDQGHYSLTILRNKRDVRDKKMTNSIEEELSNNIPSDYIMKTILRKASVLEQSRIDLEPVSIHAPKSAIKKDYDDLAEEYINE